MSEVPLCMAAVLLVIPISLPRRFMLRPGAKSLRRVRSRGHSLEPLHRHVQRFRGGLVFKPHRRCVSLNSRSESNKEEET